MNLLISALTLLAAILAVIASVLSLYHEYMKRSKENRNSHTWLPVEDHYYVYLRKTMVKPSQNASASLPKKLPKSVDLESTSQISTIMLVLPTRSSSSICLLNGLVGQKSRKAPTRSTQITQKPLKRLPIGIMVFPANKAPNVAGQTSYEVFVLKHSNKSLSLYRFPPIIQEL